MDFFPFSRKRSQHPNAVVTMTRTLEGGATTRHGPDMYATDFATTVPKRNTENSLLNQGARCSGHLAIKKNICQECKNLHTSHDSGTKAEYPGTIMGEAMGRGSEGEGTLFSSGSTLFFASAKSSLKSFFTSSFYLLQEVAVLLNSLH
jgi:hypothetical protein